MEWIPSKDRANQERCPEDERGGSGRRQSHACKPDHDTDSKTLGESTLARAALRNDP
jgi:hypothetical protein